MRDDLVALRTECERVEGERDKLETDRRALLERNATLSAVVDRLAAIAGKPIPIYISDDLMPRASLKTGATQGKILVCSIPKSGTYLYARLLERLGVAPSGLHVAPVFLFDNRLKTLDEARHDIRLDEVQLPIQHSIKLIAAGQFALSHLSPSPEIMELINEFTVLFVHRNLRDVLVSHMRYISHPTWGAPAYASLRDVKDGPEKMLRYLELGGSTFFKDRCRPVVAWIHQPQVLRLSFEAIYGDRGRQAQAEVVDRICAFCGIKVSGLDKAKVVGEVIGALTPTWSGARTSWQSCWNEDVERRFIGLGGRTLGRELGYAE